MKMKRGVLVQVVGKEAGVDRLNPPPPGGGELCSGLCTHELVSGHK